MNAITSDLLLEHLGYLEDERRLAAYARAMRWVGIEGKTVLDLGAGTGILGLMAARLGARRVYAVEQGTAGHLAQAAAAAAGLTGRVMVLGQRSPELMLPEQVDVIVCDQVSYFGLGAGLPECLAVSAGQWLRSGGVVMPSRLMLAVAGLCLPTAHTLVTRWQTQPGGFDFATAGAVAADTTYPLYIPADSLGTTTVTGPCIDLATGLATPVVLSGTVVARVAATLHGLAGWFNSWLSDAVVMTNAPAVAGRINRPNLYLPFAEPLNVAVGERLAVRVVAHSSGDIAWQVETVDRPDTARQSRAQATMLASIRLAGFAPMERAAPEVRP